MLSEPAIITATLAAALVAALAQYLFKRSVPRFGIGFGGITKLLMNRNVLLGLLIYVLSLAFYLLALGSGELSFVYPLFSSTFIFVMLISKFTFKERLSAYRILGVLLILLGISMISLTY